MVEPSATVKMDIYSSYVMHAFSNLLSHGGYIYYINLYGTDDVCMCTCMCCGDAYKDRMVFLISNLFTHTTMWIEVPLLPLIYTMLQEALLFKL